ncbi:MAG TPA: MlaD family protein, partial [Nitriliruptorales bacterium]
MSRLGLRLGVNLVWLVAFSVIVVIGAFLSFVSGVLFTDQYPLSVSMPQAGGVLPGQEVTLLGRSVGTVKDVVVVREGVRVDLGIDSRHEVPRDAVVQVLRRSPIGEQAVDFQPAHTPWEPAEPGSTIHPVRAVVPSEVPFLLEKTRDLFAAIEVADVGILVRELAAALGGRGETLRQLNRDALDLNRTLVAGIPEFQRLLDSSQVILATLQAQR